MTLATLQLLFQELTEEPTTIATPTRMDYYLQAGQERVNRGLALVLGGYIVSSTNCFVLANGTQEYPMPADFVRGVYFQFGTSRPLNETSISRLRKDNQSWRSVAATTPTDWYANGMTFGLYPKPDAPAAALGYTFRYIATPPTIPSGGPTWLSTQDHRLIVWAAVQEYSLAHPDDDFALERATRFEKLFDGEMQRIQKIWGEQEIP